MVQAVTAATVRSGFDEKEFVALPYRLYRNDKQWVPPLHLTERQRWSLAHNPSLLSRKYERWVARRDGRTVGRIAAIYDPLFSDRWEKKTGFFGFFECEDDAEAAAMLFDVAHEWLRGLGLRSIIGPVNMSTNDETGFLIEGFDSSPTLLSPYNPRRYVDHVFHAGYEKKRDYYAYRWIPELSLDSSVVRIAKRLLRPPHNVRTRQANPKKWEDETRILLHLYNASFADVWGFVPMNASEFNSRANDFKPFYRPEFVIIAEIDERPAGFGLILPDINAVLRSLRGRLLPLGWLRLLLGIKRLRTGRFILTGVLPQFASRGIGPLIAYEMTTAMRNAGYEEVEVSLVQEANNRMRHVIEAFGCRHVKTYRLFERAL